MIRKTSGGAHSPCPLMIRDGVPRIICQLSGSDVRVCGCSQRDRVGLQYVIVPMKVTRKDAHVNARRHQTAILIGF